MRSWAFFSIASRTVAWVTSTANPIVVTGLFARPITHPLESHDSARDGGKMA